MRAELNANKKTKKKKTRLALLLGALVLAALAAIFLGYSLFPSTRETRFQAAAISDSGEGIIAEFALRSRPGNGALLVDIANAQWRGDTEASFRAARAHAERVLGVPLSNRDYELSLRSAQEGVAGESAGAALASAVVANYLDAELREDAIISAALDADNESNDELQPIGAADEKIFAAAAAGKRVFLIAESQKLKYEGELAKRITIKRVRTLREAVALLLRRTH
jgi:predicted S18 family serine protease